MKVETYYLPGSELPLYFVSNAEMSKYDFQSKFHLISFACRLNILTMIKVAGSGHIGSSLSAIDLVLASREFLRAIEGKQHYFFSSKGHDAPAIYAASQFFGEIQDEKLFQLRRLGGLPGHPETRIQGVPTNTGSLGMGISKAKGFIAAARVNGEPDPHVIVLLGDGELQEGQIWESMPGAFRDQMTSLVVLVDGNKIQSDTWTEKTLPLGDLAKRVEGCGWKYLECNGHDLTDITESLKSTFESNAPTFIYAHTIKSSGIPFMTNFALDADFYRFHSGAPSDADYIEASNSLRSQIESEVGELKLRELAKARTNISREIDSMPKPRASSLVDDWNSLLQEACENNSKVVVMDADLSYDTGTYGVREHFPDRYIQCGIAEQDMVSMAGTMALTGVTPIVHSFASFLTARALEQIFNNTTEESSIIYVGFLAGILPTAPGHSHQAVIDVGAIGSIPGIKIFEPACKRELKDALDFSLRKPGAKYLRVNSIGTISSAESVYPGSQLTQRKIGKKLAVVTSGVTMTSLALEAAIDREVSIYSRSPINSDLLNSDLEILNEYSTILVLENYIPCIANFAQIKTALESTSIKVIRIGITEIPANGETQEVLKFHKLDVESLREKLDAHLQ